MSRVWVVTPTCCTEENRRLPLLLQTIYWVRQQTHEDHLHIVVDDGSTDSTPEVLERLSRSDPKLKIFRKENGGASAAINHGVEQALAFDRPDFITVCHSDDVLPPDALALRAQLASQTGAGFVYTADMIIDDANGNVRHKPAREYPSPSALYDALLAHRAISYLTLTWQTDFFLERLRGFDPELTSAEDWDIALRSARELAAVGGTHASARHVTLVKRKLANSLRGQNLRDGTKERCYQRILAKHLSGEAYEAAMARERRTTLRGTRSKPPLRFFLNAVARLRRGTPRPRRLDLEAWLRQHDPGASEFLGALARREKRRLTLVPTVRKAPEHP